MRKIIALCLAVVLMISCTLIELSPVFRIDSLNYYTVYIDYADSGKFVFPDMTILNMEAFDMTIDSMNLDIETDNGISQITEHYNVIVDRTLYAGDLGEKSTNKMNTGDRIIDVQEGIWNMLRTGFGAEGTCSLTVFASNYWEPDKKSTQTKNNITVKCIGNMYSGLGDITDFMINDFSPIIQTVHMEDSGFVINDIVISNLTDEKIVLDRIYGKFRYYDDLILRDFPYSMSYYEIYVLIGKSNPIEGEISTVMIDSFNVHIDDELKDILRTADYDAIVFEFTIEARNYNYPDLRCSETGVIGIDIVD